LNVKYLNYNEIFVRMIIIIGLRLQLLSLKRKIIKLTEML